VTRPCSTTADSSTSCAKFRGRVSASLCENAAVAHRRKQSVDKEWKKLKWERKATEVGSNAGWGGTVVLSEEIKAGRN
jgi:hypothetical protein